MYLWSNRSVVNQLPEVRVCKWDLHMHVTRHQHGSPTLQHSMGGVAHIPKGRNMQCDTLSRLPDYCVDLDSGDIM